MPKGWKVAGKIVEIWGRVCILCERAAGGGWPCKRLKQENKNGQGDL